MQFVVERNALLKELTRVTGVIVSKTTIPILANVRIDAGAGGLLLRATDLDIEAEAPCAADVTAQGLTTVDGKLLADFVKRCPDGSQLAVTVDGDRMQMKLVCGRTKGTLPVLSADDFPTLQGVGGGHAFLLEAKELKRVLGQVKFAMSTSETQYHLNGICLQQLGEHIVAVATDSHRLGAAYLPLPAGASGVPPVILPRKLVGELTRLLPDDGEVALEVSPVRVSITVGEFKMVGKLIDGNFPDWQRVVPRSLENHAFVDRELLSKAVDRVRVVLEERGRPLQMTFNAGEIALLARGDGTTCEDAIDAECDGGMSIGMNCRYLLELLGSLPGDRVCIGYGAPGDPMKITNADDQDSQDLMILMPMHFGSIRNEERQAA
jgi:DNA polymerase-3 subunit beta